MTVKKYVNLNADETFISYLMALVVTPLPVIAAGENENNVHLYGALVAEPCVVPSGDEEIHLDFGSIIDKYLNTRTPGQ